MKIVFQYSPLCTKLYPILFCSFGDYGFLFLEIILVKHAPRNLTFPCEISDNVKFRELCFIFCPLFLPKLCLGIKLRPVSKPPCKILFHKCICNFLVHPDAKNKENKKWLQLYETYFSYQ